MGVDVYGVKNEKAYFQRNWWGWRPLANFCLNVGEGLIQEDEATDWHNNNERGLDEKRALELADRLQTILDSGRAAEDIEKYKQWQAALPMEPCKYCNTTGTRHDLADHPGGVECNACHGKGEEKSFQTAYWIEENDIVEFVQFLRVSGGFRIC